jgi:hypothetical protein
MTLLSAEGFLHRGEGSPARVVLTEPNLNASDLNLATGLGHDVWKRFFEHTCAVTRLETPSSKRRISKCQCNITSCYVISDRRNAVDVPARKPFGSIRMAPKAATAARRQLQTLPDAHLGPQVIRS